ncbi:MAG: hypothetical protein IPJ77_13530, partial [Planctomycetes bacterium]|nr:hypothetical protein [Planctomycetota bacterium]
MKSLLVLLLTLQTGLLGGTPGERHVLPSFARVESAVKHGGTYHLATGTWTRGPTASSFAGGTSDIVYNCTSASGYFTRNSTAPSSVTMTASGRLPSTTSPESVWNPFFFPAGRQPGSARGCADAYTIDGFQIAYCAAGPGPTTAMTIAFYSEWTSVCASAPIGPPQGGPFALTGLPGNGSGVSSYTCWTVNVDLAGSGASFTLLADGDGVYSANTDDAFGWSFSFPSATSTASAAWALIAGSPVDASGPLHPGHGWPEF